MKDERILKEKKLFLESIKEDTQHNRILKMIIDDCKHPYISVSNNVCFRFMAPFNYYRLLCETLKINFDWECAGLSATAHGNGWDLDWVEEDIILALNNKNVYDVNEWRVDRYELIEEPIPTNYSIWNAHILQIDNKFYLKLYNHENVKNYSVDLQSLKALEVDERTANFIESNLSGGRNPKEVERKLKSNDQYIRTKALYIKPFIEKFFNTLID